PYLLAKDRTGIDVVAVQHRAEVELCDALVRRTPSKIMTVPVDDPDLRRGIEHLYGVGDEVVSDPVVVVERKDVAATRHLDGSVPRRRQATVRLIHDVVAAPLQRVQDLQRPRLDGAVVYDDELAVRRRESLDAGDGLDQQRSLIVAGN